MNSIDTLSARRNNQGKISNASAPSSGEKSGDISTKAKVASPSSETITLSGRAIMLARLFGEDESTYTGRVEAKDSNVTSLDRYLTTDDRAMLAEMYEYAQNNGIDLRHVDALAGDLGGYRKFGTTTGSFGLYDLEGHAVTVTQSSDNQQIIDRIKASSSLSQTAIDQGFIQSEMVTGGHAANYAFLERMINVFSSQGRAAEESGNTSPGAYDPNANKLETTVSADVQLVIPEADYISVNGVGQWRTPELAAANAAENQNSPSASGQPDVQDLLSLLDRHVKRNNANKNLN